MESSLGKNELMKIINDLDRNMYGNGYYVTLVGSSPLIYEGSVSSRLTNDIDYIDTNIPNLNGTYGVMNNRAMTYIDSLPYNYEDRLRLVSELDNISIYAPSYEDHVVMKLIRYWSHDVIEITELVEKDLVDIEMLADLVYDFDESASAILADDTFRRLLDNFEDMFPRYADSARREEVWRRRTNRF